MIKRKGSSLKRGGPIKRKSKTPEQIQQGKEEYERMWQLFEEHWQLKKQKNLITGLNYWQCESCLTGIWGENKSLYHDHLLEKSKYPALKYEIENLFLCCSDCHTKKTNCRPTPKHLEAIEIARKRFGV